MGLARIVCPNNPISTTVRKTSIRLKPGVFIFKYDCRKGLNNPSRKIKDLYNIKMVMLRGAMYNRP